MLMKEYEMFKGEDERQEFKMREIENIQNVEAKQV